MWQKRFGNAHLSAPFTVYRYHDKRAGFIQQGMGLWKVPLKCSVGSCLKPSVSMCTTQCLGVGTMRWLLHPHWSPDCVSSRMHHAFLHLFRLSFSLFRFPSNVCPEHFVAKPPFAPAPPPYPLYTVSILLFCLLIIYQAHFKQAGISVSIFYSQCQSQSHTLGPRE